MVVDVGMLTTIALSGPMISNWNRSETMLNLWHSPKKDVSSSSSDVVICRVVVSRSWTVPRG